MINSLLLYFTFFCTAPLYHHDCRHHLCRCLLWQVNIRILVLFYFLYFWIVFVGAFCGRKGTVRIIVTHTIIVLINNANHDIHVSMEICSLHIFTLSFADLLSRATMSTSQRRRIRWSRWARWRTSSSRCSTSPASTIPTPAPGTLRPTSTGTEQAVSTQSSRCWNIKTSNDRLSEMKWKRNNSKVQFKALKSSIASKSNRHLYCFFENLYKHSRFYFLRKIQNCVLSFKALPCLMLWCYLFK